MYNELAFQQKSSIFPCSVSQALLKSSRNSSQNLLCDNPNNCKTNIQNATKNATKNATVKSRNKIPGFLLRQSLEQP